MRTIAQHILQGDKDYVLVSIVGHSGSTPRGVGSQMLVCADGLVCGTVGGGVVEARAIERAQELLSSGQTMLEDFALHRLAKEGLDMPCGGGVTLLYSIVRATDAAWADAFRAVLSCFAQNQPAYLMLAGPDGVRSRVSGGVALLDQAGEFIAGSQGLAHGGFQPCDHGVLGPDGYLMPLPLPHRAFVFGAGHVSHAVVPALSSVGFACTVYDCRPAFATEERFPCADRVICQDYETVGEALTFGPRDYVVIMTHSHESDFVVLEQVLRQQVEYVGFMGSRKKIATARKRALAAGIPEEALDAVHWPIGIDIKAETPAEIAISVTAECVLHRASQQ